MTVPALATELAIAFEGLRLEPYRDMAGYPTIGYGRLLSRDRKVPLANWTSITETEAQAMLGADLERAMGAVLRLCPVTLADGQLAALIDFAFNCGAGNLQASILRRKVNRGDPSAADEFSRWVWAGGIRVAGLVRRRAAETRIYR